MKEIDSLAPSSNEWLSSREPALKLIDLLSKQHQTLSIVDGCGGHLLNQLTIPGATKAFRMGVVASSWQAKEQLGVPTSLMHQFGEHSLETAKSLATLALNFHHDSLTLAVVGEFVAIAKRGKPAWGTQLSFTHQEKQPKCTRQLMMSQAALSLAYMFLQGKQYLENGLYRLSPYSKHTLIDHHLLSKVQQLSAVLSTTGETIATMESCTGGALACAFEAIEGNLLNSAWVTYDEDAKIKLGVPIEAMAYGTVYSERVALAMARAIQKETGAEIALATTGTMDTADTRPYHTDTPPGTVYTAMIIQGQPPRVERILLPLDSREKMKAKVVNKMVDDLLFLVENRKFIESKYSYSVVSK